MSAYRASPIKRDRRTKDRMNQLDEQIMAEQSERAHLNGMAAIFDRGQTNGTL